MSTNTLRIRIRPHAGRRALATLLVLLPVTAFASTPADDPLYPIAGGPPLIGFEEVTITAPEPRYVAPTTRDRIGRIWAPVLINGQGPFRMVLDTGASRSAVINRVADELRLPVYVDAVRLRGVTGSAIASAVKVDTLEVGELLVEGVTMPIVANAFGGAEGVLGAEGLAGKRLVIEFKNDRITISRSHREDAPPGFSTVPFKFNQYRGMRVEVLVGAVKATAVIDTGAQTTVGNLALREALSRRRGTDEQLEEAIIGVTEDIQRASRVRIPTIVAGSLLVRNASINFADLYIFDHWKLNSKPALLIGMDVLGVLDTLIIDYKLNELQIRTPR